VLRSSTLRRGPWPSRCVDSGTLSSAQSCTAAHSRLTSLHLGASRVAQLAAASRPFVVPLLEERRAWFSSKLHVGPQPPRVTPSRSVASCAAPLRCGPWPSRCVHSVAPGSAQSCTSAWFSPKLLGGPHSRIASLHLGESRLAQLAAASRPLASRYVQRVAPSLTRSCTSAHSRLASLHLGASRVAQLAAASRPLAVPLRAERRARFSSKLHGRLASLHIGASRVDQLAAARRPLAVALRAWRSAWFSSKLHGGPQPPRVTPPRSVACCAARRRVAALDCPAA